MIIANDKLRAHECASEKLQMLRLFAIFIYVATSRILHA